MTTKTTKKKITKKATKKATGRADSISAVARQLIKSGKTNEQVFDALVKKFGPKKMPETHPNYPAWYRRQLASRGEP